MSDGDTDQYSWSADDDRPLRELRETASPETRAPSSSAESTSNSNLLGVMMTLMLSVDAGRRYSRGSHRNLR